MKKNNLSDTAAITRQNLMDAFWVLYTRQRIEKITVGAICVQAGYNRSTFYDYFNDVYQILNAIEEQIVPPEKFERIVLQNILQKRNRKEVMEQILDFYEEYSKYFPILFGEHGDPAFRSKLIKRLSPVVAAVIQHSSLKDMKRMHYIMEYQSAAVLNTITAWYANGKDIPVEEFVDFLMSITMNGVQKEMLKLKE